MYIWVEKQPLELGTTKPMTGLEWVEAYDMLERHWPYSRTRRTMPHLIQAASRMARRRQHRPMPPRQAFKSTVDYYDALLPLLIAQTYWDRVTAWRYVRPMMIRVMLRRWAHRKFH